MAELALGALGVVPLIGVAIESYRQVSSKLKLFRHYSSKVERNERIKDTIKRVQDRVTVTFNASEYDQSIEDLKSRNGELKHLREQITQLRQTASGLHAPPGLKRRAPGSWPNRGLVQQASKALYLTLVDKWKCCQPEHVNHALKVFVDTGEIEGEVLLYVAILCQARSPSLTRSTLVELEVRSQKLELAQPTRLHQPMPSTDDCFDVVRKRAKVVMFAESSTSSARSSTMTVPVATRTKQSACHISSDLSKSNDIFMKPNEWQFTFADKLRVARALASTVLKFHSTPWLREYWRLQDFSLFYSDGEETSQTLRTLHVSTEVARRQLGAMEGIQNAPQVTEDELTICGIDNMTLHSLGVALLQIDRMVEIEPGDVMKVRKMARTPSWMLGPRYRDITQKCLRCDFGYGSDLTKPRLQEAISENIIGVLEKMMSQLSIDDD
ncbi:hypothetical protein G7Z17_g6447 [Cylindrodendrum hubeiense]|uniref:DUF7580 domain-containing protein n=1 Tax=Cylindrodendrum hubeiense TaxID=595255 RepID=A0A9P5HA76_9HYPO|nr:hypothetical protein G7Z17_g6447 [Cylindrodendrum hubeiense]